MLQRKTSAFTEFLGAISPQSRTMLLPALLEAQKEFGHISKEIATEIGETLKVPLADVMGVIEFYSMLFTEPTGETIVRVCTSPSCSARGGRDVHKQILHQLDLLKDGPTADGKYFVEEVQCLGLCDKAPSALVNETAVGEITPERVFNPQDKLITEIYAKKPVITKRIGKITPTNLDDYLSNQGFLGLHNALGVGPKKMIECMADSGLLGRGGAAFSTKLKWEGAAEAPGQEKYIVCNADEAEPGTFKDRILLENDPFAILEGMLTGGYAIGATKGFIYIRGEYPKAQMALASKIACSVDTLVVKRTQWVNVTDCLIVQPRFGGHL